ncbi:hypothetical protein [Terracoccus sp. 273MFTsu3.1]|uniref:hypothetical protein n=1 Tax=Terracoccus sp. 273MFTsu3.1 TaxID=1172188 RepID=UPI0003718F85|nr:hypothetical protein [Terracoccus sp. 273MFTsu3.1]
MTALYFGGAEVSSWRKMLSESDVSHVALSYMGLRRKVKFARPWLLDDKFPAEQKIFLDSGAFTVNQDTAGEKYSQRDLKEIGEAYMGFVLQNIDRVEMVSEFDSLALGLSWIRDQREDFYDSLPEGKFLPVWHADWGLSELESLAERYKRVGIMQTAMDGRNLVPTLNGLVRKYGTHLHGVAMTRPELMSEVQWGSVASTSWISPAQYGDTIIWTGRELKRYPKKMKDQARMRHRTYLRDHGFDTEKIEGDDTNEVLRLSLWSWQRLVESVDQTTAAPEVVATSAEPSDSGFAETEDPLVVTSPSEMRKSVATTRKVRQTTLLPIMGVNVTTEKVLGDDGQPAEVTRNLLTVRSQSQRLCASCFLADKCPMFEDGANCAYEIPVEVKTKDQMQSLQNGLIEMQTQRVLFARMSEEITGGYPDPNLSSEMDRLQKMIKTKTELEQDGFTFKMEAKGRGGSDGGGILQRMFGAQPEQTARALPAPVKADAIAASQFSDIIDVEVIEARSNS